MSLLTSLLHYAFWLSWGVIIGGMVLIFILAPLAFFTLPPLTVDSSQAAIFSGKLLTLLFGRFILICMTLFWFITILEVRYFPQEWSFNKKIRFFTETLFLVILNSSFIYLAFVLIPQMETDYFGMVNTGGLTPAARQTFREQHELSTQLIVVCFVLTLALPYFHLTRIQKNHN